MQLGKKKKRIRFKKKEKKKKGVGRSECTQRGSGLDFGTQDDDKRRERSTVNVSGGQLLADLRGTRRAQSKGKVIETKKQIR